MSITFLYLLHILPELFEYITLLPLKAKDIILSHIPVLNTGVPYCPYHN